MKAITAADGVKVDLLWRIVVLGMLAVAGNLSWRAWTRMEDTLERLVTETSDLKVRVRVLEEVNRQSGLSIPYRPAK